MILFNLFFTLIKTNNLSAQAEVQIKVVFAKVIQ